VYFFPFLGLHARHMNRWSTRHMSSAKDVFLDATHSPRPSDFRMHAFHYMLQRKSKDHCLEKICSEHSRKQCSLYINVCVQKNFSSLYNHVLQLNGHLDDAPDKSTQLNVTGRREINKRMHLLHTTWIFTVLHSNSGPVSPRVIIRHVIAK
jgi:hypothetical protein